MIRLVWLVRLWTVITCTMEATANPIRRHNTLHDRSLGVHALYNLPAFAVEFTTLDTADITSGIVDTTNGQEDMVSETGEYDSSISYPIRTLTEEFLTDQFRVEINDANVTEYFEFYQQMQEVDLQVRMYHSDKKNELEGHVHLIAEMFGSVSFQEPEEGKGKPSNAQVKELFGSWMEDIFKQHRDLYLRKLVQSNQELLKEIVALEIITNYDINGNTKIEEGGGFSTLEQTLLTLLIILVMIGMGWMCLVFAQRHRYNKSLQADGGHMGDQEHIPAMHTIRHGEDGSTTDNTPGRSQQNYSMPSNPFGYISSAFQRSSFGKSQREAFTTPRPRSSLELQATNIAVSSERGQMDDIDLNSPIDDHYTQTNPSGYYPFANIWRNLSHMWDDARYFQDNDGLIYQDDLPYSDDDIDMMMDNRHAMEQWMEFSPEDEEDYDFAFKDFPRKDGTPCLIYDDDKLNTSDPDIFSIDQIGIPTPTDDIFSPQREDAGSNEILSDEAFRNLLGQNSSFEDEVSVVSDRSSPEFKQRLSSLFVEKHRQYEKRAIVEKHQQKRKKEREMERRERQKDMHRELEALEASMPALVSEKWKSKHHVSSPKPSGERRAASPKPYSPNMQIARSPKRSDRRSRKPKQSWDMGLPTYERSPRRSPLPSGDHLKPPMGRPKSFDVSIDGNASYRSQQISPSDLFVDAIHRGDRGVFDKTPLNKLSLPGLSTNEPSPQSVMDDIHMMPPRIITATKNFDRRGSRDVVGDYKSSNHRQQMETISNNTSMDTISSSSPRRPRGISPARRGLSPARTPTRGRRNARGISPGPRSSSKSSRHSRQGSNDDVFIHGVAALV